MSTPANTISLGFSYMEPLYQEVLHSYIPPDPAYPSHPHPDYYDAFVNAMGIGAPIDASLAPKLLQIHSPPAPNRERKPGWVYYLPSDWSVEAAVNNAFSAFNWYGPIPVDQEDNQLVWRNWSSSDGVNKERRIFSYLPAHGNGPPMGYDDDKVNLIMSVYGWATAGDNAGKWIYPDENGETVPMLFKRGPTDWKTIFNGSRWTEENNSAMSTAMVAVIAACVTILTLGAASAAAIGLVAGFSALLAAMKAVADKLKSGDTRGLLNDIASGGKAASQIYDNTDTKVKDAVNDLKNQAPSGDAWLKNVSVPFGKLKGAADSYIAQGNDQVQAFIKAASTAARGVFPQIDLNYWQNALSKEVLGDSRMWALKAQGLAKDQLADFVDSVPWYMREAAGLGAAVRAAEILQETPLVARGSMWLDPNIANPQVMRLTPEAAAAMKAIWATQTASPDQLATEKAKADNLKRAMKQPLAIASPTLTPVSTATKNVVIGGVLSAGILFMFRDYIFGKLLDGAFKK